MPTAEGLLSGIADSDDAAYVLSRDYKIVRVNAGFTRFALANGGTGMRDRWQQESMLDAISPALRGFFYAAFEQAWATGERWEHDYECSSALLFRRFRMIAYPVQGELMLVVHSLIIEEAHTREASVGDEQTYAPNGFVKMCSYCRRVRHPHGQQRWDWVPAYLNRPLYRVSHGLCGTCSAIYWPEPAVAVP